MTRDLTQGKEEARPEPLRDVMDKMRITARQAMDITKIFGDDRADRLTKIYAQAAAVT